MSLATLSFYEQMEIHVNRAINYLECEVDRVAGIVDALSEYADEIDRCREMVKYISRCNEQCNDLYSWLGEEE